MYSRKQLQRQLQNLIASAIKSSSRLGILVTGKSGIGKTKSVELALNALGLQEGKHYKYVIDYTDINKLKKFFKKFRILVLDEIHLLKEQEFLFRFLSGGGSDKVIILITNRPGDLLDALRNRTLQFTVPEPSDEDLIEIFKSNYQGKEPKDLNLLPEITRLPRQVAQIANFMRLSGINSVKEAVEDLGYVFYKNTWLTFDEYIYTLFLEKYKRAAEKTIKAALGWDSKYLREIEQSLIEKGLLRIENRGRSLRPDNEINLEELI